MTLVLWMHRVTATQGNNSADPEGIFMDETLLVFPSSDTITLVWHEYGVPELGVRRPYIYELYKGCASFEYMVVPIDPASPLPAQLIDSDVPPHLALCTTSGKMMQAWGVLPAKHADALCLSVVERMKAVSHGKQHMLTTWDFDVMELTHETWSSSDWVPSSFHSESSDQTMVEQEKASPDPKQKLLNNRNMHWEVGSSASRSDDDEDNAITTDSHISGVDSPDDFAKASAACGDHKVNRRWLKEIKHWAQGILAAEADAAVLNDAQVGQYITEQPRLVTNLDLNKADYLVRHSRLKNGQP
ncbi:hypothetical protein DFH06DRAFT_1151463 [Mycena polygramma]|nr:hypothetical protein DFH06DRAFT_1151463 [Mycena polygramma]